MNMLLWVLQILTALLFAASGVMKVFLFDKVSHDVASFGAMPRRAWAAFGVLELACAAALLLPAALHSQPLLPALAAAILALESLVFIWVHVKYREPGSIAMSAVLGCLMAFIAYGRFILHPLP
jgi:uncharacterized membrane protein YphA (DoxX/SURF4 family)